MHEHVTQKVFGFVLVNIVLGSIWSLSSSVFFVIFLLPKLYITQGSYHIRKK